MARDCQDRQRGSDWRNDADGGRNPRAIGTGDAVDREMEVSFIRCPTAFIRPETNQFLSNS